MTADVAVSLSVLAGIVALSDVTRRLLTRALANTGLSVYAVELVSTFQLCCCTHELKLLSEVGGIEPRLALTFTYLASVVHGLTFSGAIGNPSGALERAYHAKLSGACALRRIACQFAAAAAARATVPRLWGVGLSRLHARHKLLGFRCTSPIHAPLHEAAAVELACAFAVQTVITHTQSVEEKYRVHAVAAVITTAVYAGFCFKCGHDMADVSNATDQSLLPVSHLVPLPSTANKVSASNVDMTWLMAQTPPISHYFLSRTWYHCPPLQIRMSRKAQTQMDVEVNAVEKHLMKFIRTFTVPGGSVTGAVFNPALAFSTQFPCSGHSFLEYCVVYWLGPLLGMMSSVLLLDKLVPALSGKPSPLHLPAESKKKA